VIVSAIGKTSNIKNPVNVLLTELRLCCLFAAETSGELERDGFATWYGSAKTFIRSDRKKNLNDQYSNLMVLPKHTHKVVKIETLSLLMEGP
jgi:hypothetical protein